MRNSKTIWAPHAWLTINGREEWHASVLLRIGNDGCWSEIESGVNVPDGAEVLAGPLLPGMVNAHSHAFQRAFAGLAEIRSADRDDFWTWRDRMYHVALRITPEQQRAVATWLNIEFLHGGYTHLCEFHYLHTQPDGRAYADPLTMTRPLIDAAVDAGLGLTMIPVVYERAGFDVPTLRDDQRRFAQSATQVWESATAIRNARLPHIHSAIGIHSLRAATPDSIRELLRLAKDWDGPIHTHIAEQTGEVDACQAATGSRPIEWLATEGLLDSRWQLVHATHTTPGELDLVADSGAGVILCPTTEGNLGDGFCDFKGILEREIPFAMGSDSQVGRAWHEELRLIEYVQRLKYRQRCLSAAPDRGQPSTASRLASSLSKGGARAAGFAKWGLTVGARADGLVADANAAILAGVPCENWLDVLVFASPSRPWRDVLVAGKWAIRDHVHPHETTARMAFENVMKSLWRIAVE